MLLKCISKSPWCAPTPRESVTPLPPSARMLPLAPKNLSPNAHHVLCECSADRGGTVRECMEDAALPEECANIKRMFFECRRGQLVSAGARVRGGAMCVLCVGLCASALSSLCIRPSFPDAPAVSIPVPAGHAESYTRQQMGWGRKFIGSTKFKSDAAAANPQTRLAGFSWSMCHMLATEVPKMLARAFLELPWAAVAHPWTRTLAVSRQWTQHRTRFTDAAYSSVRHVL
jgi:hypothetical protein